MKKAHLFLEHPVHGRKNTLYMEGKGRRTREAVRRDGEVGGRSKMLMILLWIYWIAVVVVKMWRGGGLLLGGGICLGGGKLGGGAVAKRGNGEYKKLHTIKHTIKISIV